MQRGVPTPRVGSQMRIGRYGKWGLRTKVRIANVRMTNVRKQKYVGQKYV